MPDIFVSSKKPREEKRRKETMGRLELIAGLEREGGGVFGKEVCP